MVNTGSRFNTSIVLAICAALALAAAPAEAQTQRFPLPTGPGEPLATWNGQNLYPYSAPFADHVGRFVDSSYTKDFLAPPPRTLRAKGVSIVRENNKVYMRMGEHFVSYTLSTFFSSQLGQSLTSAQTNAHIPYPESYLQWSGAVYPESSGSGWSTYVLDGQQRLYDYDWDDRGYAYVAYYIWGFGIVQDSSFQTVRQVDWNETAANPQVIGSFRSDGKYYVVVGGEETEIWDVTSPTSPVRVRTLSDKLHDVAVGHLTDSDAVGLAVSRFDPALNATVTAFDIYRASTLIAGGEPAQSIVSSVGKSIASVTTDDRNFYVLEKPSSGRSFSIHTFIIRDFDTPAFNHKQYNYSGMAPNGIRYGENHLTVWGSDDTRAHDVWLFRLNIYVPERRELGDFIKNYYTSQNPPAGYTNAARDGYTGTIYDALYTSYGGKEYLIISDFGLGDVYELQSADRLSITSNGVVGTQNVNSPTAGTGTYYGDPISFTGVYQSGSITINWNFGNPEGVASENQRTTASNQAVTHQYAGLTTASAIQAPHTVTATDASSSSNSDSTNVTMKVPTARLKLDGTTHLFPGSNIASVGILAGDRFVDASDGTLESHFVEWTYDSTTSSTSPDVPITVGTCGSHSITQTARYIPYTGSGNSVTPVLDSSKHFTSSVGPLTFDARPFLPEIEVSPGTNTVTFRNQTRLASATFNAGAQWNVIWQLEDAGGGLISSEVDSSAVGTVDTFTVDKTSIQPGYSVVMSISVEASAIANTSCATQEYRSAQVSFALEPPDPVIVRDDGCTQAGSGCFLSIGSASGKSTADWSVSWYLDDVLSATGQTFRPSFPSAGTYEIRAVASNDFGIAEDTLSITVTAPACIGAPTAVSINYKGVTSGCLGTNCTDPEETFEFTPLAWGYTFQACDKFQWDFGDGSVSFDRNPQHKFPGEGSYEVDLLVSNQNGSATSELTITFGDGGGGCPTEAPQDESIFVDVNGPDSGCTEEDPNCLAGEAIQFTGLGLGYTFQTCDSFSWDFGDGETGSEVSMAHAYAEPGTYTAAFTVSNSLGSATGSIEVTIQNEVDPCPDSPVLTEIAYIGSTSECSHWDPSKRCDVNESIQFLPLASDYEWQNCDEFLWDFGDGSTSTEREPTYEYSTRGDFTVTLVVTNENGAVQATRMMPVGEPAAKPVAVTYSYSPEHPKPGEAVQFTAETEGGDPPSKWEWDFGDGSEKGLGQTVEHVFEDEGTFRVGVAASNSGGFAYVEKIVRVAESVRYLLPVAIHAVGANDSAWRTDLHVFQPEFAVSGPIEIEVDFKGTKKTVFFDSSTEIFEDFLGEITSSDDAGPIFITSPAPVAMWTRTYNQDSSGVGTFGQLIPAVRMTDANEVVANDTYWNVGGLRDDSTFRTNLGFVNPGLERADLTVHIHDAEFGVEIGTFDVSIDPHQLVQQSIRAWFPTLPGEGAFGLRIQSRNGVYVVSYVSVIDNVSNDPVFIRAIPDSATAGEGSKTVVIPGVGHFGSWRSDLTLFNPDSQGASLNLELLDGNGSKLGETRTVSLPSKGSLSYTDLLPNLMEISDDVIGTLKVTTTSANEVYPVLFDRTYNDQGTDGTFGQGIPAIPAAGGNAGVDAPAFVPGVRSDFAYYTNLGLVSLAESGSTTIQIQLLNPVTGLGNEQRTIELLPDQSAVIPKVLENFLYSQADHGTLKIRVLSGGPVWAYGSLVDQLTKDPEYIPAVPAD